MDKLENLLRQAVATIKVGQRAQGRALLYEILRHQPENITAWSLLSVVAKSEAEQRECLATVLAIDPDNTYARKAVRKLQAGETVLPPPPKPKSHESPIFEVYDSLHHKVVASIVLNGYNIHCPDFLGPAGDMHSFKIVDGELRLQWRNQEILSFRRTDGRIIYVRVAALPVENDGFGLLEIL